MFHRDTKSNCCICTNSKKQFIPKLTRAKPQNLFLELPLEQCSDLSICNHSCAKCSPISIVNMKFVFGVPENSRRRGACPFPHQFTAMAASNHSAAASVLIYYHCLWLTGVARSQKIWEWGSCSQVGTNGWILCRDNSIDFNGLS